MNILHQAQDLVTDRDLFMMLWMKGNTLLSNQKTQQKKKTERQKPRTSLAATTTTLLKIRLKENLP